MQCTRGSHILTVKKHLSCTFVNCRGGRIKCTKGGRERGGGGGGTGEGAGGRGPGGDYQGFLKWGGVYVILL